MKKHLIFTLFLSAALISLIGCKKSSTEITCNLSAPESQPSVAMNVVYSVTQTGDGIIGTLSYATNSGLVTVQGPKLPWTITVPVIAGTHVTISASGMTENGSLTVSYVGAGEGSTIQGSDSCEQQT
ncbi:MAG: hypothetical protein WC886_08275, partial [Saccharofermentanaceae bacterium]